MPLGPRPENPVNLMWEDLRTALRWLRGDRLVTLLIVLTIALGVGANAAVFGALEGLLLRPFQFRDGDRTVLIWRGAAGRDVLIPPLAEQVAVWRNARTLERLEPFAWHEGTWQSGMAGERIGLARVTNTLASTLGATPVQGRYFTAADTRTGAEPVALISWALWKARFGAEVVTDRTITLDGKAYTIVGVLPRGFKLPSAYAWSVDVALPLQLREADGNLSVAAVLRRGITPEQAEAELTALSRDLSKQQRESTWTARVLRPSYFARGLRQTLTLLTAAVAALLLIAAINVANLLLSRAQSRDREMAIRTALGAPRLRLFRQVLFSSALLGLAGGAAGLLIAVWARDLLLQVRPDDLQILDNMTINTRVFGFGLFLSLITGLLFGLAPALHAARWRNLGALRSGMRVESSVRARRFRVGLVSAEVALAFAILIGAGLLLRSIGQLLRLDPGFGTHGLATLELQLPEWKYESEAQRAEFYRRAVARVRAQPGVLAATLSGGVPPRIGIFFGEFEIAGRDLAPKDRPSVFFGSSVGAEYFSTVQQRIVQGRGFTLQEVRDTAAHVWMLGEAIAHKLFPQGDAVGQRMRLGSESPWGTIVGVAAHVRATGLIEGKEQAQLYAPLSRAYEGAALLVRTQDRGPDPSALRRAVLELDRDVVIARASRVDDLFSQSIARERFAMQLLSVFAILAVVLAAVGLYGVLLNLVRQRTREIGIRMALGADRRRVIGLVLRQGTGSTLAGLACGIPLALWGSRLLVTQLHGVGRLDPIAYGAACVLFCMVAALAMYLPARQAASVQPLEVMRPG